MAIYNRGIRNEKDRYQVPPLPEKELFGFDKFLSESSHIRRICLQNFLRYVVKSLPTKYTSESLIKFLDVPIEATSTSLNLYLFGQDPEQNLAQPKLKQRVKLQKDGSRII